MQTANINLPVRVTGRHVSITDAMRDHAERKVASLHLDYPRIIEARVILDVESNFRHRAEIVLHCANHITIEAHSTTADMYASIDETIAKVARMMRKHKTAMLKRNHRPGKGRKREGVKFLADRLGDVAEPMAPEAAPQGLILHKEVSRVKPLQEREAIEEMEIRKLPFVLFKHPQTERLSILYRRQDGDYAVVHPELEAKAS
ncbi:MAG: ribosome-associated translation inhibitor RaiA [Verrucomicrobia bacterium]|nr:ribosome-associated translation inhibitor RaiA [Verrucomicrobiota bacterium]